MKNYLPRKPLRHYRGSPNKRVSGLAHCVRFDPNSSLRSDFRYPPGG